MPANVLAVDESDIEMAEAGSEDDTMDMDVVGADSVPAVQVCSTLAGGRNCICTSQRFLLSRRPTCKLVKVPAHSRLITVDCDPGKAKERQATRSNRIQS